MRPKSRPLGFIGAIGCIVLLTGCINRDEASTEAPDPPESQAADATPASQPDRTISLSPQARNEQSTDPSSEERLDEASSRARTRDLLFAEQPGDGLLPAELAVGPLADRYSDDADVRSIYRTVGGFLASLESGDLPIDSVLAESRSSIRRTLDFALTEELLPDSFAVGSVTFEGEIARLNVALYGDPGSTAGEITVATEGGRWYISDIQIDFSRLAEEATTVEQFEPVRYDWQIHSR